MAMSLEIRWLYLSALLLLLVLSYIYSGSEVAFFSLPPSNFLKRKKLSEELKKAYEMLNKPDALLMTILLGNTAVNSFASSIFAVLASEFTGEMRLPKWALTILDIVVFTGVLLVLGEVTPKLKALNDPEKFIEEFFPFIDALTKTRFLFAGPFSSLSKFFDIHRGGAYGRALFDEIHEMLVHLQDEEKLMDEEKHFISEFMKFLQGTLRDFAIPREEMPFVKMGASVEDVIRVMRDKETDFVAVIGHSLDDIRGVITATGLLKHIFEIEHIDENVLKFDEFKPFFLVEHEEIKKYWESEEIQKDQYFDFRKHDVVILIDEFGGTVGAVSKRKIYETFFSFQEGIQLTDEGLIVDGYTSLAKIEMLFGVDLNDAPTVAGFILKLYHEQKSVGKAELKAGTKFKVNGLIFEILEVEDEQIKKVKIVPDPDWPDSIHFRKPMLTSMVQKESSEAK